MSHIYQSDTVQNAIDQFNDAVDALADETMSMNEEDKDQLRRRVVRPAFERLSSLLS